MTVEYVVEVAQRMLAVGFFVALPILAIGMGTGLLVAVFQAATQIQEASLNFVPKLIGIGIAIALFGNWILAKLIAFTVEMVNAVGQVGG